jgi:hypothetical protein
LLSLLASLIHYL